MEQKLVTFPIKHPTSYQEINIDEELEKDGWIIKSISTVSNGNMTNYSVLLLLERES
jgi:hypothetical protein